MGAAILLILMLAAGVGLALLSGEDSGYLLLAWNGWRVEINNLVVAIAFLLGAFLMLHWLLNSVAAMQRGRSRWRLWRALRRDKKGQRALLGGLRHLAEGHWSQAEKKLLQSTQPARHVLLGYLGAAQAAHHLGDANRRDRHLAAATRAADSSAVAIGLQRARTLAGEGQFDQAIAALNKARRAAPRHPQLLSLLQEYYGENGDWQALLDLLPALRREKLITRDQENLLSRRCHFECLKTAESPREAWRHLPKKYAHDAGMLGLYLHALIADDQAEQALALLTRELNRQLEPGLLEMYGTLTGGDAAQQLIQVQKWLQGEPGNTDLLLAAGRIAVRADQIPTAIEFYEALPGIRVDPHACQELARLQIGQQRGDAALETLQRGLKLALG